jgi:hypothetical protein
MMTSTHIALVHFSDSLERGPALPRPVAWLVARLLPLGSPAPGSVREGAFSKREQVGPELQRNIPAAGAAGPVSELSIALDSWPMGRARINPRDENNR